MDERVRFIAAFLAKEDSFTELCDRFRVSRKTGYKWAERYEEVGVTGLSDRSRAPNSHPNAIANDLSKRILSLRKKHPTWGPKKLRVILEREPALAAAGLPVASTIGEILRRHGVSGRKKRIRRSVPYGEPLGGYDHPNAIWCADFKGHFAVRSGSRCHPLTITDGFSRKLLRCTALKSPLWIPSQRVFESAFREFGIPEAIRTDNGTPFSSLAPGGLSRLSVWWIKLGIRPERIAPGRPDQNGRHERMHRTLKLETAHPPRWSITLQQRAFDEFKTEYNSIRPHEALGQRTPDSLYQPSIRPFPKRIRAPEYPDHFKTLKTYPNGIVTFRGVQWMTSGCLKQEWVGLEEVDDDHWKVHFGPVALGILNLREIEDRAKRSFGKMIRLQGDSDGVRRKRRLYRR
jgi:transposase InsO family protein